MAEYIIWTKLCIT